MLEADTKFVSKHTTKERKLKYQYAKLLRDMMLESIEAWKTMLEKELGDRGIESQVIENVREVILQEANAHLVWKVLKKEDRYDTPYYRSKLEELKKLHPNLKIENKINSFVSCPVFDQADIDQVFSQNSRVPGLDCENIWDEERDDLEK
ncbi:hypothetical protein [uncultured Sphaerochaeta sp.]|uniref:hypothetical protein n=1 Tax=uncultured Sphaerochaeta sp. TaxID=886478 RepID=UPI0029C9FDFD|nr:hypothetical protein [uncultured Sphaerochaeta sp.]